MTFEEAKIQVLIEEHGRMPLDHHNLPTAAKDCPLCKKATMTTEEKKVLCEYCSAPHANKQELESFGCWECGKKPTPPETGKEWELIFDTVMNVATCECSKTCSLHSKSNYKGLFNQLIALIESSALAQGEKIGAEKERERLNRAILIGIKMYTLNDMKTDYKNVETVRRVREDYLKIITDALKGEL